MERNFLFGSSGSFEQAFPQLEKALIEFYETGDGVYEQWHGNPPNAYTKQHQVEVPLMRCSNQRCKRGGYEIDREIYKLTLSNATKAEFVLHCPGDEGSPKGRRKGEECLNTLRVRLTLIYKLSPESK